MGIPSSPKTWLPNQKQTVESGIPLAIMEVPSIGPMNLWDGNTWHSGKCNCDRHSSSLSVTCVIASHPHRSLCSRYHPLTCTWCPVESNGFSSLHIVESQERAGSMGKCVSDVLVYNNHISLCYASCKSSWLAIIQDGRPPGMILVQRRAENSKGKLFEGHWLREDSEHQPMMAIPGKEQRVAMVILGPWRGAQSKLQPAWWSVSLVSSAWQTETGRWQFKIYPVYVIILVSTWTTLDHTFSKHKRKEEKKRENKRLENLGIE